MTDSSTDTDDQPLHHKLDTSIPQTARIWNYWLGGKDNFAADRQVGDEIFKVFPEIVQNARAARAFLVRAVRFLTGEASIRQFLDIGTGLPVANNTHEVAQQVAPESRIVYVDKDPLVLVHARALLTSRPEGATDYIDADLRDPEKIIQEANRTLSFAEPVAVVLMGILGHIDTVDEVQSIVKKLVDAIPSGSYVVISDGTNTSEKVVEAERIWNESASPPYRLRSPKMIARFFDGLELVEPGLVSAPLWRPEPGTPPPSEEREVVGGVARKP